MTVEIAHFTSELSGGAGVAAGRLHAGLLREGLGSRLYYCKGEPTGAGCVRLFAGRPALLRAVADLVWGLRNPRKVPGVFFTSPRWYQSPRLQDLPALPALVNLHWISQWIDHPGFFASLPKGLPIVWSLHDLNPFTGGCHLAGRCERFVSHCGDCPQLQDPAPRDAAYRFFRIKDRCYAGLNLHIVGNSEWTTAQARRSALMRHARSFQTISLGLDTEGHRPVEKALARKAFGIDPASFVVGFACGSFSNPNKGGRLLVEALQGLATEADITLLAFGADRLPDGGGRYRMKALGSLRSPQMQSVFYSACDVFAVPSFIESFGLTALEASACATPVVAFRTGGLVDVVADGTTGLLESEVGSVPALLAGLRWMWQHPAERHAMGRAARQRVEERFTSMRMARRYAELYRSLVSGER